MQGLCHAEDALELNPDDVQAAKRLKQLKQIGLFG